MQRFLMIAIIAAVAALYLSGRDDMRTGQFLQGGSAAGEATPPVAGQATAQAASVSAAPSGEETIRAGASGHFEAVFSVNGRTVAGMVDTGATFVALNESTAREIGIGPSSLDYRYAVTTANGSTQAARVTINMMEFGSVRVRDVDAFVLKDKALSGMLVGMSFMNRLKSYKVQDGVLSLRN